MSDPDIAQTWAVPDSLAGERLDRALALLMGVPRNEVARAIDAGDVSLDGAVVTTRGVRLRVGQLVLAKVLAPAGPEPLVARNDVPYRVVFNDEHVLVVDKPAGVVVHPGAGSQGPTLVEGLLAVAPEMREVGPADRPGVVHRLDVGTSGLLVFARTTSAYESLVEQFSSRTVRREYAAAAKGHFESRQGVVDAPIARSVRQRTRMAVVADGRPARTHFAVVASCDGPLGPIDAVRCRLETGRTHQIRVHLAAIGHPVVGDTTYGGGRLPGGAQRPFLHAAVLGFQHPASGEELTFVSSLPADLLAAWVALGGAAGDREALEAMAHFEL